jgi:hypothetical protein
MAPVKESKEKPKERIYVVPATSFHFFANPAESYLVYDNHRKMLKDLFENSRKYYCAEDIKQDLMYMQAPIPACSTYDETPRVAFAMLQQCPTLEEFQGLMEHWLSQPDAMMPGSLIVPASAKSEVGRNLQPATELTRGCFALCAVAIAVVVCGLATCPLGASARDLRTLPFPEFRRKFKIPDGIKKFRVED